MSARAPLSLGGGEPTLSWALAFQDSISSAPGSLAALCGAVIFCHVISCPFSTRGASRSRWDQPASRYSAQSVHWLLPCGALLTASQALGPALDSLSLHQPSSPPLPGGSPSSIYGHSTSSGFPVRAILPSSPSPREGGKGPKGRDGQENC